MFVTQNLDQPLLNSEKDPQVCHSAIYLQGHDILTLLVSILYSQEMSTAVAKCKKSRRPGTDIFQSLKQWQKKSKYYILKLNLQK